MLWSSGSPAADLPTWTIDLLIAEAWGVPPWTIEEDASALWIDRFIAFRNAQNDRNNKDSKRTSTSTPGQTVKVL